MVASAIAESGESWDPCDAYVSGMVRDDIEHSKVKSALPRAKRGGKIGTACPRCHEDCHADLRRMASATVSMRMEDL